MIFLNQDHIKGDSPRLGGACDKNPLFTCILHLHAISIYMLHLSTSTCYIYLPATSIYMLHLSASTCYINLHAISIYIYLAIYINISSYILLSISSVCCLSLYLLKTFSSFSFPILPTSIQRLVSLHRKRCYEKTWTVRGTKLKLGGVKWKKTNKDFMPTETDRQCDQMLE